MNASREWVHGLVALILGLFLLGISSSSGIMKNIVDIFGNILAIPEYPAVLLREVIYASKARSGNIEYLNNEVSRLRKENADLRLELSKLNSEKIFSNSDDNNTARVTLRAPVSWWSEVRINKGSSNNITQGLPIFSNGYLTGRISSVSQFSSWAELITSSSFMIPAVIEETRELGVIAGDGNGAVWLKYIPAGRGARTGFKVSTAMIGEQIPPGLPIGKIGSEYITGSDGYASYKIDTGADLSQFYTVNYQP